MSTTNSPVIANARPAASSLVEGMDATHAVLLRLVDRANAENCHQVGPIILLAVRSVNYALDCLEVGLLPSERISYSHQRVPFIPEAAVPLGTSTFLSDLDMAYSLLSPLVDRLVGEEEWEKCQRHAVCALACIVTAIQLECDRLPSSGENTVANETEHRNPVAELREAQAKALSATEALALRLSLPNGDAILSRAVQNGLSVHRQIGVLIASFPSSNS